MPVDESFIAVAYQGVIAIILFHEIGTEQKIRIVPIFRDRWQPYPYLMMKQPLLLPSSALGQWIRNEEDIIL